MTNIEKTLIDTLTSDLIMMAHEKLGMSMISAMRLVYGSDTFRALMDVETCLYKSSALELFSILDDERCLGKMVPGI